MPYTVTLGPRALTHDFQGYNSVSYVDDSKFCVLSIASPTAWDTVRSTPGIRPSLQDLGAGDCSLEATPLRDHCPTENSIKTVYIYIYIHTHIYKQYVTTDSLQLYKTQHLHVVFTSSKVFTFTILTWGLKLQPLMWSKFLSIFLCFVVVVFFFFFFFFSSHSCLGIQRALIFPYTKLVSLVPSLEHFFH